MLVDRTTVAVSAHAPRVVTAHPEAVVRAIIQIRGHLDEPLHLSDHASVGAYSPFHFHRMFREVTGTTPARFLAAERMARAKDLLAHSTLLIRRVQKMVGYDSLGTFTSQFSRTVGVTPGEFRRLVDQAAGLTLSDCDPDPGLRSGLPALSVDAPGWFCTAGFFVADLPAGAPTGGAIFTGNTILSATSTPNAGHFTIFAVAVPDDSPITALGLCPSDVRVGRLPISPGALRVGEMIQIPLRRKGMTDPPVVSVAALSYMVTNAARRHS